MRAAGAVDALHSSDLQGQEEGMHLLQLAPQQFHLGLEGTGGHLQTGTTSRTHDRLAADECNTQPFTPSLLRSCTQLTAHSTTQQTSNCSGVETAKSISPARASLPPLYTGLCYTQPCTTQLIPGCHQ